MFDLTIRLDFDIQDNLPTVAVHGDVSAALGWSEFWEVIECIHIVRGLYDEVRVYQKLDCNQLSKPRRTHITNQRKELNVVRDALIASTVEHLHARDSAGNSSLALLEKEVTHHLMNYFNGRPLHKFLENTFWQEISAVETAKVDSARELSIV